VEDEPQRLAGAVERRAVPVLLVEVTPKAGRPFSFLIVDRANG
jgi:hypothetical protein